MRRALVWIAVPIVITAGCVLVGGYDFDGYTVDAGATGDGAPLDAGDDGSGVDAEAGACVGADLTSDPHNCGTCGHDCLRGLCAGDAGCQPWTIVSGQKVNCADTWCAPLSLTVAPGRLFWAFDTADGGVYRAELGDGGVSKMAAVRFPSVVRSDGTFVYWTDSSSIFRCTVQGCSAGASAPWEPGTFYSANDFAFPSGKVVFVVESFDDAGDGQIVSSDNSAAPSPTAIVSGQHNPNGIVVDGASLYWLNAGDPPTYANGSVWRADLDGNNAKQLASGQKAPQSIGVHGGRLYWVNAGTPPDFIDGAVMTCDPLACASPTPIAAGQPYPFLLAVDASGVYWTNTATRPDAGFPAMTVNRCSPPSPGCTQTAIATGPAPWAIATDDKAVYWTDVSLGAVMGLAK
jgi:hypothetical protein